MKLKKSHLSCTSSEYTKKHPFLYRWVIAFCLYAFCGILSANNQILNLLFVCVILLPRGIVTQFPCAVKYYNYFELYRKHSCSNFGKFKHLFFPENSSPDTYFLYRTLALLQTISLLSLHHFNSC